MSESRKKDDNKHKDEYTIMPPGKMRDGHDIIPPEVTRTEIARSAVTPKKAAAPSSTAPAAALYGVAQAARIDNIEKRTEASKEPPKEYQSLPLDPKLAKDKFYQIPEDAKIKISKRIVDQHNRELEERAEREKQMREKCKQLGELTPEERRAIRDAAFGRK